MSRTKVTWNGEEIRRKVERAYARGTIGIAERIAAAAKRNVHKITTTLARSIHVAKANTGGLEEATQGGALVIGGAVVDVGSWIEYACVEEVSRGHRYMQPAVEQIRATAHVTMRTAFREEGF